jgi:WD40 repeat protein
MNSLLHAGTQLLASPAFFWRQYLGLLLLVAVFTSPAPAQELTALTGHVGGVVQSQYVPGGKIVVTAGHDGSVKIWQAADGMLLRTLEGHQGQVLSLAVSDDGRHLLSGGRDNSIRFWDVFVPDPVSQREDHRMGVTAILVGPEGAWVATGSADKSIKILAAGEQEARRLGRNPEAISSLATNLTATLFASGDVAGNVQLWNPETGLLLGKVGAHQGGIAGMAFHPTAPQLITAGANGTVKRWTLPLVNPRVVPPSESGIRAVVFSPDGKTAYAADEGRVRAVQVEDGKVGQLYAGQLAPVQTVGLNKDGSLLVAGTEQGEIHFWNTADAVSSGVILGHAGAVHAVVMHPTQPQGMSAGADGTIRFWNIPQAARPLAGHTGPVQIVAVSNDGKWIATGSDDKSLRIWNVEDGAVAQTIAPEGGAELAAIAFQADGVQLASGDAAGTIQLSTVTDGASTGRVQAHTGAVAALSYRPDATQLVSSGADGLVKWWNLPLTADRTVAEIPAEITAAVSDGKTIVAGSTDGAIRQMDAAAGTQLRAFPGHTGTVVSLAMHPQGSHLASGQNDGAIRVFKASDGVILATLRGHTGPVTSLAYHPTEPQLISGGADGTLRVWSIPDAATVTAGVATTVAAATFSADKTLLAIAGVIAGKPTIQVRNATTGAVTVTLVGHTAAITSLAFSPDKTRLVSGSADMTARIWTVADAAAEPVLLEGHTAALSSVAFAANGAQVFSGAADNTIKQWNVADGAEVRTIAGHTQAVTSLSVAGAVLASASADASLRLWNTADGAAIRTVSHGAAVSLVRLSADGKLLASVGADKIVKLWNAADGAAIASLQGHAANVTSLGFSSDSQRLLSCGGADLMVWDAQGNLLEGIAVPSATALLTEFAPLDAGYLGVDTNNGLRRGTYALVRLLPAHEGAIQKLVMAIDGASVFSGGVDKIIRRTRISDAAPLATLTTAAEAIQDMAISTDGKQLVAGSGSLVYRWELATAIGNAAVEPAASIVHPKPVLRVAINMDGTRVVSADDAGVIRFWDAATGLELQQLAGHSGPLADLYLNPDSTFILSAGRDKTLRQWTPAVSAVIKLADKPTTDMAWTPDGTLLVLAGPDNIVRVWDQATATVKHELTAGEMPLVSLAIRKDGARLVAGGIDGNLYSWPLAAGVPGAMTMLATAAAITRVDFDTEGTRLLVAGADGQARILDGELAGVIERVSVAEQAAAVTLSSDGKSVLSTSANNVSIQDLSVQSVITGHAGAVTALLIKPDGSQLISGGVDMTVRLWNVADGVAAGTVAGPTGAVTGLSISADAVRLVASSADKNVYAWTLAANPNNLAADLTIEHPESVLGVAISADNVRLVSSSVDGTARAWDAATGLLLESFVGHEGAVTALGLAADGKGVVTGGFDKTVRLWNIAAEQVFAADAEKLLGFVMLPDASQVGVIGTEPQVKWFAADGTAVRQLAGAAAALNQLAISQDASQAAAADANGNLLVWNLADGALLKTIESGVATTALAFGSDGTSLLAAGSDNHLRVYDLAEATLLQDQLAAAPQTVLSSLPGGKEFLSADDSGIVFEWAIASPTELLAVNGHNVVYGLDLNSDGSVAASCGADNMIQLWDLATGQAIRQLAGHEGPVYSIRFSDDDKLLVSASADGTVRVWNVADGAQLKSLMTTVAEGETVPAVYDAAFNAAADMVVAADSQGIIKLWNVASGELVRNIGEAGEAVYRVAFSENGQRLLACGHAGTLTVRNVADGAAAFTIKLPSVAYSAEYAPGGATISAACANGNTYLVPIPEEAR